MRTSALAAALIVGAVAWDAGRRLRQQSAGDAGQGDGADSWGGNQSGNGDMPNQSNRAAWLLMIASSEGTDRAGGYRALYGSTPRRLSLAPNLDHHPAEAGSWRGVRLPDGMCRAAGQQPGCVSTAAGRYQITLTTWRRIVPRLGLGDFSESSQDAAALELTRQAGALDLVDAGRISEAIAACAGVWASLPGNSYGQPQNGITGLLEIFRQGGGTVLA
jgi:muramidase (phage lysozyme)